MPTSNRLAGRPLRLLHAEILERRADAAQPPAGLVREMLLERVVTTGFEQISRSGKHLLSGWFFVEQEARRA